MESQAPNTHAAYPVTVTFQLPQRYERIQVLLRVLVWIALGSLLRSTNSFFGLLYFLLPIAAAVLITRRGGGDYLAQDSRWLSGMLEWVVGVYAYLLFVTDRFPLDASDRRVRVHVQPQGAPTVGRSILRLVTSIPNAIVLALLGIVSAFVWVIAAIAILWSEHYPESLQHFQRDLVAVMARWLAYHASLVDLRPPLGFSNHGLRDAPTG